MSVLFVPSRAQLILNLGRVQHHTKTEAHRKLSSVVSAIHCFLEIFKILFQGNIFFDPPLTCNSTLLSKRWLWSVTNSKPSSVSFLTKSFFLSHIHVCKMRERKNLNLYYVWIAHQQFNKVKTKSTVLHTFVQLTVRAWVTWLLSLSQLLYKYCMRAGRTLIFFTVFKILFSSRTTAIGKSTLYWKIVFFRV